MVLVDDVISKGATLIAAHSHVANFINPNMLRAFGLIRTKGYVKELDKIVDPFIGKITCEKGEANRAD